MFTNGKCVSCESVLILLEFKAEPIYRTCSFTDFLSVVVLLSTLLVTCVNFGAYLSIKRVILLFFFCGAATRRGSWPPHSWGFLDHTQWRTTVGRTPLDELSAHHRDLYLTTHNRQTSMPRVGFEPTISAGERPQTYTLDHAATETGMSYYY